MDGKIASPSKKPKRVVERNVELVGALMRYLLAQPKVMASLPTNFELVILPDDDPEMQLYNLKLLDSLTRDAKPIVLARLRSSRRANWRKQQPSLYVPLAV
jgi:hypothetical protein